MAIESGLAWTTYAIDDAGGTPRNLAAKLTQASFSTPVAQQDITVLTMSAMARMALLADLQDQLTILFDDASNESFDTLKTIGGTSGPRTITRAHSGQILASESNLSAANWSRTQAGELTASVTAVLADGTVPTWTT
jgi:hypothetical protein